MLHLRVGLPLANVPAAPRRAQAARLGEFHAQGMQTSADRVNVAARELGPGKLFRGCSPAGGRPAATGGVGAGKLPRLQPAPPA